MTSGIAPFSRENSSAPRVFPLKNRLRAEKSQFFPRIPRRKTALLGSTSVDDSFHRITPMSFLPRFLRPGRKSNPKSKTQRPRQFSAEMLEDRRMFIMGAITEAALATMPQYNGVAALLRSDGGYGSAVVLSSGRHILTAAHVVDAEEPRGNDEVDNVTFRLKFATNNNLEIGFIRPFMVQIHPEWNGGDYTFDLAIITLPEPLPANVRRYDIHRAQDELKSVFTMVGWGDTGTVVGGREDNDPFRAHMGLNYFDTANPNTLVFDVDDPRLPYNPADQDTTNLGTSEAYIGFGDSGGPAFINNRIAGIASNNPIKEVDHIGSKGIFTRVSTFAPWIDKWMGISRDLVIDMNNVFDGKDGIADTIRVERNAYGDRLLVTVNGKNAWNEEIVRWDTITFRGSSDAEKIYIAGDLGKPVVVDGRTGVDTLNVVPGRLPINSESVSRYTITSTAIDWRAFDATNVKFYNVDSIRLSTSRNNGEIRVESMPYVPVTVKTNDGTNTFLVGIQGQSLDALALAWRTNTLNIVGGGEKDSVSIFDEGAITKPTLTLDGDGLKRSRDVFKLNVNLSSVDSLEVLGAHVGSRFQVHSTYSGMATTLKGSSGSDQFQVGDSKHLLLGVQDVLLDGAGGSDTLVVDDAAINTSVYQEFAPDYEITKDRIVRTQSLSYEDSTTDWESNIRHTLIERVTLRGSHRPGWFWVREVPASINFSIEGGTGDEFISVGALQASTLDGISGLKVQGGGGFDNLAINDHDSGYRGDTSDALGPFNQYGIHERAINAHGVIISTNDALESIRLNTTAGRDKVEIVGSSPNSEISVTTSNGDDTIRVGGAKLIDRVNGAVLVNGGDGFDKLILDDRLSQAPRSFTVADPVVTVANGQEFTYYRVESLDILGGRGDDAVIVRGAGFGPLNVDLGAGEFQLIAIGDATHSLDDIRGDVRVSGGGTIVATISDAASTTKHWTRFDAIGDTQYVARLNSDTGQQLNNFAFQASDRGRILYEAGGAVAGTNNQIDVNSVRSNIEIDVLGGPDKDVFTAGPGGGNASRILGPVAFHSAQADSDFGYFNDYDNPNPQTYTVRTNPLDSSGVRVERLGMSTITYNGLTQLHFNSPLVGGNITNVQGVPANLFLSMAVGDGDAATLGSAAPGLGGAMANIAGVIQVASYSVDDAVTLTLDDSGNTTTALDVTIVDYQGQYPWGVVTGMTGSASLLFRDHENWNVDIRGGVLDDSFVMSGRALAANVSIDGGAGNDILIGSGGNRLSGGAGRDLLIAGSHASILDGGLDEDILIGGIIFDVSMSNLNEIRSVWTGDLAHDSRVSVLQDTRLTTLDVYGNDEADRLTGGLDALDLFFGELDNGEIDGFDADVLVDLDESDSLVTMT